MSKKAIELHVPLCNRCCLAIFLAKRNLYSQELSVIASTAAEDFCFERFIAPFIAENFGKASSIGFEFVKSTGFEFNPSVAAQYMRNGFDLNLTTLCSSQLCWSRNLNVLQNQLQSAYKLHSKEVATLENEDFFRGFTWKLQSLRQKPNWQPPSNNERAKEVGNQKEMRVLPPCELFAIAFSSIYKM